VFELSAIKTQAYEHITFPINLWGCKYVTQIFYFGVHHHQTSVLKSQGGPGVKLTTNVSLITHITQQEELPIITAHITVIQYNRRN
jgi:hypothetical protein